MARLCFYLIQNQVVMLFKTTTLRGVAFLVAAFMFSFLACTPTEPPAAIGKYEQGVFVINKGNAASSVSFFNRVSGAVVADVYKVENADATLGKGLQSLYTYNGKTYLVLNGTNRLVVVDSKTFKLVGNIDTSLRQPRYFMPITIAKGYVSEWGADGLTGAINVVNLDDYATKKITYGKGCEQMLFLDRRLYLANGGGKGVDSTIAIVDVSNDSLFRNIRLGAFNPKEMDSDVNGDIWILCDSLSPTKGALVKLHNDAVELIFPIARNPSRLVTNADRSLLYFVSNNQVYVKDLLNFGTTPPTLLSGLPAFTNLTALGIDDKTGYLYCGDALDNVSNGKVKVINLKDKTVVTTFDAGVLPIDFYFTVN
jgi:hypothetical protein